MAKLKKSLGQHLLIDGEVIAQIVDQICFLDVDFVVEIGPGRAALTQQLLPKMNKPYLGIELDDGFFAHLNSQFSREGVSFTHQDILQFDFSSLREERIALVGNFPYNISTQIIFHLLENAPQVTDLVGMFQKEVAMRVCGSFGGKNFGLQSVLVNSYFESEYLFDVAPHCFKPPPKVTSGVIRLKRKQNVDVDYIALKKLTKAVFALRRKKLRNSLRQAGYTHVDERWANLRPEQLSIEMFHELLADVSAV